MPPRVHVGPEPDDLVSAAVEAGGGEVVPDPADAQAIVWLAGEPAGLRAVLHPGVRWVQLSSAGVEQWLAEGAIDAERAWTSAAGAYGETVADHALALALAGRRRLPESARATRWGGEREGRPLYGCTVAVIGAGAIGRALIALLAPWRCRIVAVTRSGRDVPGAAVSLATADVDRVWPEADVTVLAAPATDATRRLVGAAELAAFRPDAWLVNVARGTLVDTNALVEALAAGRLGGAALDVTDPEPLPDDHALWREPRALITPHVANTTDLRRRALADWTRDNVARFARGDELGGTVEPGRGY
jgi:phosphoglycerate dehydrogenase-like enzyme